MTHGEVRWIAAVFYGMRAAVIAIVAAAGSFAAIFVLNLPFPAIVMGAGLIGLAAARSWPHEFPRHQPRRSAEPRPEPRRTAWVLAACLAAWWGPLVAVIAWRGWGDVLAQQAVFFSKAALVTFGGAYAVLSYLAQAAVQQYRWLEPGEMLVGLGLAETTPGPLIMVTEFVGFLGAYRHPGGLDPLVAGTLGAVVTVWATFAPSFLWIFLGAPYVEHLHGHRGLNAALSTITASVVGVIRNLALWLGMHTMFRTVREVPVLTGGVPVPVMGSIDPIATLIAAVAFVGMWRLRWGIAPVVAGSAAAGLLGRALMA